MDRRGEEGAMEREQVASELMNSAGFIGQLFNVDTGAVILLSFTFCPLSVLLCCLLF